MGGKKGNVGKFGEEKNILIFNGIKKKLLGNKENKMVNVINN